MAVPNGRLRGRLRPPTVEQVLDLGRLEHLHLTPAEVDDYQSQLGTLMARLDRLDELMPPPVQLRHLQRDPGRVPELAEDQFNAFVRLCRVEGAASGPLAGVTLGVKDNLAVAGIPITNASRTFSYTPTADAVVIERLLDAGVTITGKTNLDDFSTSGTGESSGYGPPRNPIDPARSAGGSSGGSGSAVASGAVDLAIGVDQGGSARIPASFCGVVSLKATHGLIPSHGLTHVDHTIDYVCPIARSVELVARATDVMSGHDWRDPQWARAMPTPTRCVDALGRGVAGLRVGIVVESTDDELCEPGVLQGLGAACEALEAAGAEVSPVSVPLWSEAWPIALGVLFGSGWSLLQSEGIGSGHLGQVDEGRVRAFALSRRLEADSFPPLLKLWLMAGRYLHDTYHSQMYARAQNLRLALRAQIDLALSSFDLLITPTTPQVAPRLLDRPAKNDGELLDRGTTMVANTAPLNLSGHPALAVPSIAGEAGMPTSIQLVGRHFDDALTIAAGAAVEAAVGSVLSLA
jgi:amidase